MSLAKDLLKDLEEYLTKSKYIEKYIRDITSLDGIKELRKHMEEQEEEIISRRRKESWKEMKQELNIGDKIDMGISNLDNLWYIWMVKLATPKKGFNTINLLKLSEVKKTVEPENYHLKSIYKYSIVSSLRIPDKYKDDWSVDNFWNVYNFEIVLDYDGKNGILGLTGDCGKYKYYFLNGAQKKNCDEKVKLIELFN